MKAGEILKGLTDLERIVKRNMPAPYQAQATRMIQTLLAQVRLLAADVGAKRGEPPRDGRYLILIERGTSIATWDGDKKTWSIDGDAVWSPESFEPQPVWRLIPSMTVFEQLPLIGG